MLHALGAQQRGQRWGHAVEGRLRAAHLAALGALDGLPVFKHLTRARDGGFAEHVRMPPDEFRHHGPHHVVEREGAGRLGDVSVEEDVQEEVAQLACERRSVAAVDGVDDLVGLLDRQLPDGLVRLLAVPRTVAAQAADDGDEVLEERRVGRGAVGVVQPEGIDVVREGGVTLG